MLKVAIPAVVACMSLVTGAYACSDSPSKVDASIQSSSSTMILAQAGTGTTVQGGKTFGGSTTDGKPPMEPKGAGAVDPASPGPASMGGASSGGATTGERMRQGAKDEAAKSGMSGSSTSSGAATKGTSGDTGSGAKHSGTAGTNAGTAAGTPGGDKSGGSASTGR